VFQQVKPANPGTLIDWNLAILHLPDALKAAASPLMSAAVVQQAITALEG